MTEAESGLLGVGSAGNWSVEIEEITQGDSTAYGVDFSHTTGMVQFSVEATEPLVQLAKYAAAPERCAPEGFVTETSAGRRLNVVLSDRWFSLRLIATDPLGGPELFVLRLAASECAEFGLALKDALSDAFGSYDKG